MMLETCGQALLFSLLGLFREIQNGSFEVILCINLTRGRIVDTMFTQMFTNPFCLIYLTR